MIVAKHAYSQLKEEKKIANKRDVLTLVSVLFPTERKNK